MKICFSKYIVEKFDLFPSAQKIADKVKEKEDNLNSHNKKNTKNS